LESETVSSGYVSWVSTPYDLDSKFEIKIEDDLINQGGEKDMMGLYEVYVVDTKKGKLLFHNDIVAKSEDKAKLRVAMGQSPDIPDDVEFFVNCIGQWESKKPREVKIVKEN